MENRFGLKDFVLYALLVVLIGVVLLAMVQYDRQHEQLNTLVDTQRQQAADIGQMQATLKSLRASPVAFPPTAVALTPYGSAAPVAATPPGADPQDPFARMRAAIAKPDFAAGDTLVWSGPNINKMTPLLNTDSFAGTVQDLVLQSLLTRDPVTLDWQPLLARPGWTVVDHTADYLAYLKAHPTTAPADADHPAPVDPACPVPISVTFHVRPEATFSDGTPVTADDVVWTYDWIMNPKVDAVRQRVGMAKVRRVFKTGDDAVTFEFAEPYFDYLSTAGLMSVLPRHHYERCDPKDYNTVPCDLMGSGAYQLQSPTGWHPGDEVVLVRNEKFWGPKPALSSVRFRIIMQDQVRLTAFKNGELDRLAPNAVQYDSLTKNQDVLGRTQHYAYDTVNTGYRFVAWNQNEPGRAKQPFADKRVRQAMTMMIDRQRICDDILLGYATVATGPFNPLGKQCDPAIKPWPFDVARAKALLAEAGYKADGTGTVRDAGGDPLRFKLTYPSGSPLNDRMALFMKDTLGQGGVTLDPDPQDWSIFADRLKTHDFDAIMLGWTAGLEGDLYQTFDSAEIANGGENWMGYHDPKLDALIERARSTVDEAARMPLWRQCHAVVHDDQPYTFMTVGKTLLFLDKRVQDVSLTTSGVNDLTEWYVPTGLQKYTN